MAGCLLGWSVARNLPGGTEVTFFPLVFRFPDVIIGTGFVARVIAEGRVFLTEEDGEFWMYGVIPGGVVGGAKERAAAFREKSATCRSSSTSPRRLGPMSNSRLRCAASSNR